MISFPPAKINLGLNIIEKRSDNFHNIETVFFQIQWCDILEIIKADSFKIFQSGLTVEGNLKDNLCVRAYDLLKTDFNLVPVHIYLHKFIPMGAGLGGGSSDAAYTLMLLNDIFLLKLSKAELANYASKLGSDCACFLHQQPMFAEGRGEILSEINLVLNGYSIVIVMPPAQVKTAEAYSKVVPHRPTLSVKEIVTLPIEQWKNNLKNDFEDSVFKSHPIIKNSKEKMYELGAIYASMSGSGAAVFGIFDIAIDLQSSFENSYIWQGNL